VFLDSWCINENLTPLIYIDLTQAKHLTKETESTYHDFTLCFRRTEIKSLTYDTSPIGYVHIDKFQYFTNFKLSSNMTDASLELNWHFGGLAFEGVNEPRCPGQMRNLNKAGVCALLLSWLYCRMSWNVRVTSWIVIRPSGIYAAVSYIPNTWTQDQYLLSSGVLS